MSDRIYPNAGDIRKRQDARALDGLDKVFQAIEAAAETNHQREAFYAVRHLNGANPELIIRALVKHGFVASYEPDQRDGDYLRISWEPK